MKRLLIALAMVLVATAVGAGPLTLPVPMPGEITFSDQAKSGIKTFTFPDGKIDVVREEKYLTIIVYSKVLDPIVYRVWPCGRIEMKVWKEVAPNQGSSEIFVHPGTSNRVLKFPPYIIDVPPTNWKGVPN